jgi:4-aminobutyrate aminotransferase / (S)-3-amino-2-methylpropionate transaminase
MLTEFNRYNTWVGDPARVLLFNAIYDFITKHNLVSHTADIGAHVYNEIEKLQKKFPNDIQNLRGKGQGTFIAWDCPWRDEFIKKMRAKGVHMGGCGERAVRLRPMLVFQRKYVSRRFAAEGEVTDQNDRHADILIETMEKVLGEGGSKL